MRANDMRAMLDDLIRETYAIAERLEELRLNIGHRSPHNGRGPRISRPMSDEVRDEIHYLRHTRPNLSQAQIARIVGVDSGRVSETLAGKRQ